MSEETQENSSDEKEVHTAEEDKQEHIKQRLKEMGVSEDSERPSKPWYIKYGVHMAATVLIVIGIVYYLESSRQEEVATADSEHMGDASMMTANNPSMNTPWSSNPSVANNRYGNNPGLTNNTPLSEQQKKINELQANYQKSLRESQLQEQKRQRERQQQMLELQKKHMQAMNKIYQKQNQGQGNNLRQHNQYAGSYPPPNWRPYYGPNLPMPNRGSNRGSNWRSNQTPNSSGQFAPANKGFNYMPKRQPVYPNNQVANAYPPQRYYQRPPYPPYPYNYNGWPHYQQQQ